jgi:hypothetical protein
MAATDATAESPLIEHRKSFLSLRWFLIILGSYLTLFPRIGVDTFNAVFGFALAFAVSNLACGFIRRDIFGSHKFHIAINVADLAFVAVTFFLLRAEDTNLYLAFIAVFMLAVVWRDLKILVFAICVVSVLYGVFTGFRAIRLNLMQLDPWPPWRTPQDVEQFLTLSLFLWFRYFICS